MCKINGNLTIILTYLRMEKERKEGIFQKF